MGATLNPSETSPDPVPTRLSYATPDTGAWPRRAWLPYVVFVVCAAVAGWATFMTFYTYGDRFERSMYRAVLVVAGLASLVLPHLVSRGSRR